MLAASPEFHRTPAAGLGKRAESFVAEREAASKFGALRPELSVGCVEPPKECQGCSAFDEMQVPLGI